MDTLNELAKKQIDLGTDIYPIYWSCSYSLDDLPSFQSIYLNYFAKMLDKENEYLDMSNNFLDLTIERVIKGDSYCWDDLDLSIKDSPLRPEEEVYQVLISKGFSFAKGTKRVNFPCQEVW